MKPKELRENGDDESDVQEKYKLQRDDERVFGRDFNTSWHHFFKKNMKITSCQFRTKKNHRNPCFITKLSQQSIGG